MKTASVGPVAPMLICKAEELPFRPHPKANSITGSLELVWDLWHDKIIRVCPDPADLPRGRFQQQPGGIDG